MPDTSPLEKLIAQTGVPDSWDKDSASALEEFIKRRYGKTAFDSISIRSPGKTSDDSVPYAAVIEKTNPKSGPYAGMSIAIFPVSDARCLVTFVVGTNGIDPDAEILGNPGHARKVQAICTWMNRKYGNGKVVAWAKQDPVRVDQTVPANTREHFPEYASVFGRYGKELYSIYAPTNDAAVLEPATAFFDLMFEARGFKASSGKPEKDQNEIRAEWYRDLLPDASPSDVAKLLRSRRYVVIQGPPGTGKSRLATELVATEYAGNGTTVQFHPNTTYESFVGGLQPVEAAGGMGFRFAPALGSLMEAVKKARESDRLYLLHIDEINRADLSKVLGEAIYLLEPSADRPRGLDLPYDFGEPFGSKLSLPDNLHILGTMNTADRSLAIVDVAVRRRFAFVDLWPQAAVVQEHGGGLANRAFVELVSLFVDHATGDAFNLIPGHSYFLQTDDEQLKRELKVTLVPLLREYLSQGYVGGFAEHIRAYIQWLDTL